MSQAIDDEWVADMNKRGFDGKKLLQTARDLIAKGVGRHEHDSGPLPRDPVAVYPGTLGGVEGGHAFLLKDPTRAALYAAIDQAKADWKAGRFAPIAGETEFIPLPE